MGKSVVLSLAERRRRERNGKLYLPSSSGYAGSEDTSNCRCGVLPEVSFFEEDEAATEEEEEAENGTEVVGAVRSGKPRDMIRLLDAITSA